MSMKSVISTQCENESKCFKRSKKVFWEATYNYDSYDSFDMVEVNYEYLRGRDSERVF